MRLTALLVLSERREVFLRDPSYLHMGEVSVSTVSTLDLPNKQAAAAAAAAPLVDTPVRWSLATRLAFRWGAIYFGVLYPASRVDIVSEIPSLNSVAPIKAIIEWVAAHVLGATGPLGASGGGDRPTDWAASILYITIATIGMVVWSWLDRDRSRYVRLYAWFRLVLRVFLGMAMVGYGLSKVIPVQMPAPALDRLLQPYGSLSPMGVLWTFMGSSYPYERFTGLVEVVGGVLLLLPGLTTAGALVAMAAMTNVFILNLTYDVYVKLLSFHLLLISLVLLAPDARRLVSVIIFRRAVDAAPDVPLARGRRAMRVLIVAQSVLAVWVLGMEVKRTTILWNEFGGGRPTSPLYGIWDVETMSIDGQVRPPLLTDTDRWRRVVFNWATTTSFQRMDDAFTPYRSTLDLKANTLTLTKRADPAWRVLFTLQRPAPDRLTLDGKMDGHDLHAELRLKDMKFALTSHQFHWIQNLPGQ